MAEFIMDFIFSFVLLLFTTGFGSCNETELLPEFKFINGHNWEDVSHLMPNLEPAYYDKGDKKRDLVLWCTASYPVTWNISGLITNTQRIYVSKTYRDLEKAKFTAQLQVNEADDQNLESFAFSLRCHKVTDPTIMKEAFVFIRGNSSTSSVRTLKSQTYNSKVIPCISVDPTEPQPQLFSRLKNGTEVAVSTTEIQFHPTIGFQATELLEGSFVCRQGSYEANVTAYLVKHLPPPEFSIEPHSNLIELHPNNEAEFKCQSDNKSKISFTVENTTILSISQTYWNGLATARVSFKKESPWDFPDWSGTPTKLSCVSEVGNKTELIYEWTIEWKRNFQLLLDPLLSRMHCQLNPWNHSPSISMQSVPCQNPDQCEFLSKYVSTYYDQRDTTRDITNFSNSSKTSCEYRIATYVGAKCVDIPYTFYSGIVHCSAGRFTDQKTFFTALSFVKYENWKDAPENELVRMDPTPCTLPAEIKSRFVCEAVSFLFQDNLIFQVEFRNGSRFDSRIVHADATARSWWGTPRFIRGLNFLYYLEIVLPTDAVAVHCGAAMTFSTDILWTQTRFQVKELNST